MNNAPPKAKKSKNYRSPNLSKKLMMAVVFCCSLLLGGCWDSSELQYFGVVSGIAVDIIAPDEQNGEDRILLTISISKLDAAGSGEKKYDIYQAHGKNISDAVRNLSNVVNRQIFWGHDQILLLGEGVQKEGINKHLEALIRSSKIRTSIALIAVEGNAADYLDSEGVNNVIFSYNQGSMFDISQRQGYLTVNRVSLQNYLEQSCWGYASLLLPHAIRKESLAQESSQTSMNTANSKAQAKPQAGNADKESRTVYFDGMTVFSAEGNLAGYLNQEETLAAMLWRNEIKTFTLTFTPQGVKAPVSFFIYGFKLKKNWKNIKEKQGDKQVFSLHVDCTTALAEDANGMDFFSTEGMETAVFFVNQELEKIFRLVWEKALAMKEDFLMAGDYLYRYKNREWDNYAADWPLGMENFVLDIEIKNAFINSGDVRYSLSKQ